ncbi:MAG: CRISPR-associated protein Cas4 [Chloroflexi bacterium]|nr:CRISPR-associated protein Cas4 [Chloroflexota bacterium]MCI0649460.1 CRISPR-associated protein Cas4 [Chloroflexota bacterium]MCI0731869.1 CRISPR-associated protein Cas4 [Chloroflexota bacterium]
MNDYLPLSYLNQLAYCPRRFWYMYVQGELAVNAPMLEGTLLHERAHRPGTETDPHGRTLHRRVWVWSERLNIAGFADLVEERDGALLPVEYKHGRQGRWDNDEIQLCAQALCLEEMTGRPVEQGEIFYWRSRRRVAVHFDQSLRQATEAAVTQAQALLAANAIPGPITDRRKCRQCSLQPICLPDEVVLLNQRAP